MINNNVIRNCIKEFPALQGMVNEHALGKILIKNVYQGWQGESIKEISNKENPSYTLRIGMPKIDEELKNDSVYFILHYLSYNPLTKAIEKREIVPYRNTERLYIGQSIDEKYYKDYRLFVDGKAVVDDIYLKNYETLRDTSLGNLITNLTNKVEKLQQEVANLKRQVNSNTIYT